MAKGNGKKTANGSALEFEGQLRADADKMRRHMEGSEYKHVCLGLIFLKFRGIDVNLGPRNADSFKVDLHPDLKADCILANPPFNMRDWGGENLRQDVRWKFGMPSVNNANYVCVQDFGF